MCKYGSAVLTALQANHMNVDKIGKLVQDRVFDTVVRGGSADEWLKTFWAQVETIRRGKLYGQYTSPVGRR